MDEDISKKILKLKKRLAVVTELLDNKYSLKYIAEQQALYTKLRELRNEKSSL